MKSKWLTYMYARKRDKVRWTGLHFSILNLLIRPHVVLSKESLGPVEFLEKLPVYGKLRCSIINLAYEP